MTTGHEILLVDDDPCILDVLGNALEYKGYHVTTAPNGEAAVEALGNRDFDLVLTDLIMNPMSGLDVLRKAKECSPHTSVMIITGHHETNLAVDALRLGADDYHFKPFDLNELFERVATCIHKSEAKRNASRVSDAAFPLDDQVYQILQVMSHDLRDSLVSMAAAVKLMLRGTYGAVDAGVAHELRELFRKTTRTIQTTEEFFGAAVSLMGNLEVGIEGVDLRQDVLDPVLDQIFPEIRERGIVLDNQVETVPANRIHVRGSRVLLKAVFRNLLRNAIQHGGEGCVIVIGFESADTLYLVNVYNSGPQVPAEHRDKLFTHLAPIPDRRRGNARGLGVGLYLVRQIVEQHGGHIWYEAKRNGSNFVFTLPRD
jgi:two-component system sensor histidine kinase/response regulator